MSTAIGSSKRGMSAEGPPDLPIALPAQANTATKTPAVDAAAVVAALSQLLQQLEIVLGGRQDHPWTWRYPRSPRFQAGRYRRLPALEKGLKTASPTETAPSACGRNRE